MDLVPGMNKAGEDLLGVLPDGERISLSSELGKLFVMKGYLTAAPNILYAYTNKENSIYATSITHTRITLDVMRHFGIDGEPMAAKAIVANKEFATRMQTANGWPSKLMAELWATHGAKATGLGWRTTRRDMRDLHLGTPEPADTEEFGAQYVVACLYAGDDIYVSDMTIPAANYPEHDIFVAPITARVDDAFMLGRAVRGESAVVFENGCVVLYKAFPEDTTYRSHPAWSPRRHRRVAEQIIEALNKLDKITLSDKDFQYLPGTIGP